MVRRHCRGGHGAMDGILLIDKPTGPTSHDVVARMRGVLGQRDIGHTGTLDPLASGLLVLVLGRATRLASLLSGCDKTYEATIRLGFATTTDDSLGICLPDTGSLKTPGFPPAVPLRSPCPVLPCHGAI